MITVLLILIAAIAAHNALGPAIEKTYFRTDVVGEIEGELFISETPTDLSTVNIQWPLLTFLLSACIVVSWLLTATFREFLSSRKLEVPK